MKDFNSFLATLTEDFFVESVKKINEQNISIKFPLDQSSFSDIFTKQASVNVSLMIDLLKKYHEWLSEQ